MTVSEAKLNRYKALKAFTWDGVLVRRGKTVDIRDDHPRIGAMVRAKFMVYDGPANLGAVEAGAVGGPGSQDG